MLVSLAFVAVYLTDFDLGAHFPNHRILHPLFLTGFFAARSTLYAFACYRTSDRLRAWHTHESNLCPVCNYDLRSTPDAEGPRLPQCPECGTVIDAEKAPNSEPETSSKLEDQSSK